MLENASFLGTYTQLSVAGSAVGQTSDNTAIDDDDVLSQSR